MITQTRLRLTYALLVALVPWSGPLCLYTWPAVAPPNEMEKGSCVAVADLADDFRDEVVVVGPTDEGGMGVFRLHVNDTADHSHDGAPGGYWSHFEPETPR
jgi:hypothetical protein